MSLLAKLEDLLMCKFLLTTFRLELHSAAFHVYDGRKPSVQTFSWHLCRPYTPLIFALVDYDCLPTHLSVFSKEAALRIHQPVLFLNLHATYRAFASNWRQLFAHSSGAVAVAAIKALCACSLCEYHADKGVC